MTRDQQTWEAALDRLEQDAIRAEHLLQATESAALDDWDVPDLDGPIPAELLPRALQVARRQVQAIQQLQAGISATLRHQAYTERVTRTTTHGPGSPAYVDLTA